MLFSARTVAGAAALVAVLTMSLGASAQPFERPPSFAIEKIPGFWPSGDNYTIKNPVLSDGLLRIYTLTTPYGEFTVHGDQMLRMRVNELGALHELEKIANSESYGKALLEAGLSPFRYTGRLIADPKKTVGDTMSGIGTMVDRITADIANIGKTPGDPISGLLGVTDQKRKLATKVGVDPYTDFPPLDARLSRLAEAAAAGGLTVSAAMLAVPVGAMSLVYSNLSTISTIEGVRIDELARDQTAAQIVEFNRQRIFAMGVEYDVLQALLTNQSYTPIDMAVLVAALDSMSGVEDRVVFLQRAAQIDTRSLAYFMRRHAEMLKNHQSRGARFERFVLLGGYPFNVTRDGQIVGVMPIDALAWTETMAGVLRECAADARRLAGTRQVELRITGTATPRARKELQALGWRVVENVRF
ncbi:MAG: hypothetical protein QOF91_1269 [Alphaproteobacteria bacterium]|jgi:hypothetical protein|nr:hypothetical protein [Alphaproteobacteria bacterium]MEA3025984.1 hypothetical protein [Alphaproteobacteria bacterium]